MLILAILVWRRLGPAGAASESVGAALLGGYKDNGAEELLSDVAYNIIIATVIVLATTALAVIVRRSSAWVRPVTWCALGAIGIALFIDVNIGSYPDESVPGLLPQWYPTVNGLLGLALLVTGALAALMLSRSGALDFYRQASSQHDPKWAAFVDAQKKQIAQHAPGTPDTGTGD